MTPSRQELRRSPGAVYRAITGSPGLNTSVMNLSPDSALGGLADDPCASVRIFTRFVSVEEDTTHN